MAGRILVYGAYGYTGELVARRAAERGLGPILAGRDAAAVAGLAASLGLDHRTFALEEPAAVDRGLAGAAVVLHCAGPFVRTWRAMAEACLRTGCHYVDVTGELPVFEGIAAMDAAARRAGVLLLPGGGFDVVPADCLAAHLVRRLPGAVRIALAHRGFGGISGGTARTMVEMLAAGGARRPPAARRGPHPPLRRQFTFREGPLTAIRYPSADVFAARRTTGLRDVAEYIALSRARIAGMLALGAAGPLLRFAPVRDRAVRVLTGGARGPDAAARERGRVEFLGEAVTRDGARAEARLALPEGYTFTARAMVAIGERILAGAAPAGFQTPASAFGPDLVVDVDGVVREDLFA
jgi:short subunit dehydrogenase-like uncharacterized protein